MPVIKKRIDDIKNGKTVTEEEIVKNIEAAYVRS
jgi:hypothetical protein